jgi:hypothetical protein
MDTANMNTQTILASALCGVFVLGAVADAYAADIRVRCESRGPGDRSKVSVDGNNLAGGRYRAKIRSGSNNAQSGLRRTVGDEVEFDFDSDPDDVAAGATEIAPDFIVDNRVYGKIVTSTGAFVASATATCRSR